MSQQQHGGWTYRPDVPPQPPPQHPVYQSPPIARRQPAWPLVAAGIVVGIVIGVASTVGWMLTLDGSGDDPDAASGDTTSTSPLRAAEESCGAREARVSPDESSLSVGGVLAGGESIHALECMLGELGAPDSIMERMMNTRALDGTLQAEWTGYAANWTYHPDDGLNVIIERR